MKTMPCAVGSEVWTAARQRNWRVNQEKLRMLMEKVEKASTARMNCLKKEGWRWGHGAWGRGKETRVPNEILVHRSLEATIAALPGRDEQKG